MPSSDKIVSSMEGKKVLITGATSGIGKATALGLADLGAELVIIGRSKERTEGVAKEIAARSSSKVQSMVCDLSSMNAVRGLAGSFKDNHDRLDVLINNAGAGFVDRQLTVDGYENTFSLDYLSPFVLTNLLIDSLKKSKSGRIVTVTSGLHRRGRIRFEDLMMETKYSLMSAYAQAKLAEVCFTYELARRLKETKITVNCCDPGGTRTNLGKGMKGFERAFWLMMWPLLKTPGKGASTSIFLASSTEVSGVSGKYFANLKERRSSPISYDEDVAKRLWEVSVEMTRPDRVRSQKSGADIGSGGL